MGHEEGAVERGAWFERRWARWAGWGVLAAGVVLLAVGLVGFLSARNTDSDSRATKEQVVSLRAETAELEQARSTAESNASNAEDRARNLGEDTHVVKQSSLELENTLALVSDASNQLVSCDQVDLAAFHACSRGALEDFKADLTTLTDETARLREQVGTLEGGLP